MSEWEQIDTADRGQSDPDVWYVWDMEDRDDGDGFDWDFLMIFGAMFIVAVALGLWWA